MMAVVSTEVPAFHTASDLRRFEREGIDPANRQPREHAVPCRRCRTMMWNVSALCDTHEEH